MYEMLFADPLQHDMSYTRSENGVKREFPWILSLVACDYS